MSHALRTRAARVAALALLSLVAAAPSRAAEQEPDGAPYRAHYSVEMDSRLDARLDLELKEAAVAQVLASFGQIVGAEAVIDPEIRGEVTIELHNVRAATALTAVCESLGCLWRIEDGMLKIDRDPEAKPAPARRSEPAEGESAAGLDQPIDMALKDADLRQVLESFGRIAGARITIDPSLQGKVTIQLQNTPARTALDALCRIEGCRWELQEDEEGPLLVFIPAR